MAQTPPYPSAFPILTTENVTPEAFRDTWNDRVTEWGLFLKQSFVELPSYEVS